MPPATPEPRGGGACACAGKLELLRRPPIGKKSAALLLRRDLDVGFKVVPGDWKRTDKFVVGGGSSAIWAPIANFASVTAAGDAYGGGGDDVEPGKPSDSLTCLGRWLFATLAVGGVLVGWWCTPLVLSTLSVSLLLRYAPFPVWLGCSSWPVAERRLLPPSAGLPWSPLLPPPSPPPDCGGVGASTEM